MIPGVPVHITPLTPLAFLERSASVFAERTAVVDGEDRATYAELAAEVTRAAHALRASGVGPGDRVAYLCPNARALLVAHFAVPLAGAVLVAINTRLAPEEVRGICAHSGARLLVADAELSATVAPVIDRLDPIDEVVWSGGAPPPRPARHRVRRPPGARLRRAPSRGPSTTRTRRSRSTTPRGPRGPRRG